MRLGRHIFPETRAHWPLMNFYQRFEQVVSIILSFIIAVVVLAAVVHLLARVWQLMEHGALDPLKPSVFQGVFGAIMTLLIAMEFKHSIIRVVDRRDSIVQVRIVVLIAILALARKFIILDAGKTSPATIAALAAVVLALGAVYWLVREHDIRMESRLEENDGRPTPEQ